LDAFVVAILVLLRARNREVGTRAATVLFFSGIGALALSGALVCENASCAEIFSRFLPGVAGGAAYWSALSLLAHHTAIATALLPPFVSEPFWRHRPARDRRDYFSRNRARRQRSVRLRFRIKAMDP
jgi:hypothetical protein